MRMMFVCENVASRSPSVCVVTYMATLPCHAFVVVGVFSAEMLTKHHTDDVTAEIMLLQSTRLTCIHYINTNRHLRQTDTTDRCRQMDKQTH